MNNSQTNQTIATIILTAAIALLGWLMMTVTSSPLMKGAAFLWLPAALQLIAGVWLGPFRGLIAGGLGAYLAGGLAYGGWVAIPDIIMNPIAGGFANSMLPAILFAVFKINPDLGSRGLDIKRGVKVIGTLLAITVILTLIFWFYQLGNWGYLPPLLFILITPLYLKNLNLNKNKFFGATLIVIICSAVSAAIGYYGIIQSGQEPSAALISAAGWFLGDNVSCFLGLVILASYTKEARQAGICPEFKY